MSNLWKRILVAVIGVPVLIILILLGGWYLFGLVLVLSELCIYEYNQMAKKKLAAPIEILTYILNCVFLLGIRLCLSVEYSDKFVAFVFAFVILAACSVFILNLWNRQGGAIENISAGIVPLAYLTIPFAAMMIISDFGTFVRHVLCFDRLSISYILDYQWHYFTLAVFVTIWASDTFAYFVGRAIGKHKFFERISPKKTWEGAIGGFIGAVAVFLLMVSRLCGDVFSYSAFAVVTAVVATLAAVSGDLVESLMKRDAGVKDSSNLIPGHGGVLDRFDSAILAFPAVLFCLLVYILVC